MEILHEIDEIKEIRRSISDSVLGFVPTMGALHGGHLALIEQSVKKCDKTIVSIFVNPTQFGAGEDYEKYPRNVEEDLKKCGDAGVDYVFLPTNSTIYGQQAPLIVLKVLPELSSILCGKSRPTHFDGVVQVVSIFFNIIRPDVAFFGEKDYQQFIIVKKLAENFHLPIEILSVPTVREPNGLAKSSRNCYLSDSEKSSAANIYKILLEVKQRADSARFDRLAIPVEFVENEARRRLKSLVPNIEIDYLEIRNTFDLSKSRFLMKDSRIFIAVYIGQTRLIDNLYIGA